MRTLNRNHLLALMAAATALGIVTPAASAARAQVTITMDWSTLYVNNAPWVGTSFPGAWTSSGAISDHGTIQPFVFKLGGAASPTLAAEGVLSDRILSDAAGNTITLRCDEFAHRFAHTDPTATPLTGSCTVVSSSGAYAELLGHGSLAGNADLSGPTTAFLSEVVPLSTP